MRRLASVFASKRDKHSSTSSADPPSKRLNTTPPAPPTPGLTDPAVSSASSSSGSASLYLHTPDDDHHHITIVTPQHQPQPKPLQQSSKKSWKSWLKSATAKQPTKPWQHNPVPDWTPPAGPQIDDSDEQEDSDSDPYDDDDNDDHPSMTPNALPPSPTRALINFRNLVQNSLASPNPGPTPFAQRSDAHYIFPRSSNPSKHLPPGISLRTTLLKSRLRARWEAADAQGFTPTEQLSIASLASRQIVPITSVSLPSSPFDEPALSKTIVVSPTSRGLRRWISRPCFEDRYTVFVPEGDAVTHKRVTGGALAVAALEYSETIDAMVDFDGEEPEMSPSPASALVIKIPLLAVEPPATVLTPTSVSSPQTSSQTHARSSPYIAVPSPLRNQHNPLAIPPAVALSQSAPPSIPAVPPPVPMEPPVKRGVRFQEDDKDDVIPLGYVLRMKKRREDKAKFLRAENERRALEEERLKMEEERQRRDAERAEWEAERRAWERERMVMEEERKQRKYAEEVVAARTRRESQRAGGVPSLNNASGGSGGGFFPTSPSSTSLHHPERNRPATLRESRRHSRPGYDAAPPMPLAPPPIPRREMSEPNLPTITHNNTSLPRSSPYSTSSPSPGSSRPPSIGGGPSTPSPVASGSGTRPPSVHSSQGVSSSEDVRQHRASVAAANLLSGKKRHSIAPPPSQHYINDSRTMSYPVWAGSNSSLVMAPPMPTMMPAFVMMDMPLLPPTPPFMLHQYPRQQGQGSLAPSNSNSSSRGRLSSSVNSSRERVNIPQHNQYPPRSASFPHRPEYRHATSSPASAKGQRAVPKPSSHRSAHDQRASEDSRRASMPVPPSSSQHHPRPRQYSDRPPQPSSISRGSASQQHPQLPSPWTGLPTERGKLPAAIPASKQTPKDARKHGGSSRRQPTIFS